MTMEPPDVAGYSTERPSRAHRNVVGPARVVTAMLLGCCVTSVASGLAGLRRASVIGNIGAASPSESTLSAADTTVRTAEIADVLVTLATSIVFVVWFWRLIRNAQLIERTTLPARGAAFAPPSTAPAAGWAIGAWLVPVANMVLPAYFLLRVDRLSGPNDRPVRALVIWWAVAFAISNTALRVLWRDDPESLVALQSQDQRAIWISLASVVAAVLAILVVRALTDRQVQALDAVRA